MCTGTGDSVSASSPHVAVDNRRNAVQHAVECQYEICPVREMHELRATRYNAIVVAEVAYDDDDECCCEENCHCESVERVGPVHVLSLNN
jgi:sensor c-di-GMP phosphodiesterase-like protein